MNNLRNALLDIPEDSPLAKMIQEANRSRKSSKKLRKSYELTLEKEELSPAEKFSQTIRDSKTVGIITNEEKVYACSFLDLRPGTRVSCQGLNGVVKGGFEADRRLAVVKFDAGVKEPLPDSLTCEGSQWAIVNTVFLEEDKRYQRYKRKG